MAASCYLVAYAAHFHFDAAPDVVWAAMEDLERFERWWGWLGNLKVEGDGLREGSVLRGTVSPPLPYQLRLRVVLDRCVPSRLIDARVHGDLEGTAHMEFRPAGAGTRADVTWTLEMTNRPMRVAARVAYPVLRWGHDRVVESTVVAFREQLARARRDPQTGAG